VNPTPRCEAMAGFSLVELMLSLSLGLALSGVMLQGLMAEGQNGARLSRLLRERAWQRRTLELVKSDLAQAIVVSETPEREPHGCNLAGRQPVLHLSTAAGPITYSVGPAPSAIWRGRVLMRCGPAFGLDGQFTHGSQVLNRVVIDALAVQPQGSVDCAQWLGSARDVASRELTGFSTQPFAACLDPHTGLIALRIEQQFAGMKTDKQQRIALEIVVGTGA